MSKSVWKSTHIEGNIYKYIYLNKFKKSKFFKIFSRNSVIPKIFLKKNIQLYKGNIFIKINFTKFNVGFKVGEFNVTRKPFSFPKKKKK